MGRLVSSSYDLLSKLLVFPLIIPTDHSLGLWKKSFGSSENVRNPGHRLCVAGLRYHGIMYEPTQSSISLIWEWRVFGIGYDDSR